VRHQWRQGRVPAAALSLRLVAWSAVIVLVIAPESLTGEAVAAALLTVSLDDPQERLGRLRAVVERALVAFGGSTASTSRASGATGSEGVRR
jgi:hypothetical protein